MSCFVLVEASVCEREMSFEEAADELAGVDVAGARVRALDEREGPWAAVLLRERLDVLLGDERVFAGSHEERGCGACGLFLKVQNNENTYSAARGRWARAWRVVRIRLSS